MTITYINQQGISVTLRQAKPFFLSRLDGTGRIRQTINTFAAPEQDGAFYISSTLDMRHITMEGSILAQTPDEAFAFRRHLLQIFTPKQRGTLMYRERQISCVVEEAGFVVSNIARAPAFFISLLCPSPFFETLNDLRVEIAAWLGRFHFALEIPEETGIEFGVRQISQIISVENEGDVPCGCTIVFTALGTITNPELMHVDTGQVMRLRKTMSAGEVITVTTHFANKRVMQSLGGEEQNAFRYVDIASTFLQLAPGRNTLRYNAEHNIDLLEVTILYRPQFLGV